MTEYLSKLICRYCKQELTQMGAILLSPPMQDSSVIKTHICTSCYAWFEGMMKIGLKPRPQEQFLS